ncbi:MAG: DUF3336 domain-containing protein [Pseudomonadaceae bacterium]|nr:DUF3336 domain-containing protein [Pseudomonadaceae bacterium]
MSDTTQRRAWDISLSRLKKDMAAAEDFETWRGLAEQHDVRSGAEKWRQTERAENYDWANIKQRTQILKDLRARGDDVGLLFALNEGIHGNMGGMGKSELHERAKLGTKHLIEDYVSTISDSLRHISSVPEDQIPFEEKMDFFDRASHCFGRTALMLSGAGSLGHFHTGVVKTLFQQKLLPGVISGSSAGSVVAAVLGCHSDDELNELFSGDNLLGNPQQFDEAAWTITRRQMDINDVMAMLEVTIPDMTFQEAFEKTGRCLNVTIAPAEQHQTSRLMNAITSPNVFIRTAVLASCAVPGVFPSVMLMAKNVYGEPQPYLPNRRWVDGAVTDDLPAKRLARLYGVNHYIVSQANPLALAMMSADKYIYLPKGAKSVWRHAGREMLRSGEEFTRRYLRPWPEVSRAMNMFYSVAAQDYAGDINIVPSFNFVNPQKLLGHLTSDEISELVLEGERAAWNRLAQIRTCTSIGHTLDMILDHHSEHDIRKFYKTRRPKPEGMDGSLEEPASGT